MKQPMTREVPYEWRLTKEFREIQPNDHYLDADGAVLPYSPDDTDYPYPIVEAWPIPDGWELIPVGQIVKEGDMWWAKTLKIWIIWQGEEKLIEENSYPCIRKIPQRDE